MRSLLRSAIDKDKIAGWAKNLDDALRRFDVGHILSVAFPCLKALQTVLLVKLNKNQDAQTE